MKLIRVLACLLLPFVWLSGAAAEPLAKPTGKPILVISGNISNTNVGDTAVDRDILEALGLVTVESST